MNTETPAQSTPQEPESTTLETQDSSQQPESTLQETESTLQESKSKPKKPKKDFIKSVDEITFDLHTQNKKVPWNIDKSYPYSTKLAVAEYEKEKQKLQVELIKAQEWIKETDQKVIIVFEGRDAAGKGGTIKRFMEHLNPRGTRLIALEKPTAQETSQWYFQRYIRHFPSKGEMVFCDRSWYNRAGVEHVMGYCTREEYLEFLRQVPSFERMLVNSGILLFKYWFSVGRVEQFRRFKSRQITPLKQWKLSPVDMAALPLWDDYSAAKDAMMFNTDTKDSPWVIVRSDDKKRGRINCMRHFLTNIDYPGKDFELVSNLDDKIVGSSKQVYGNELTSTEYFNSMRRSSKKP